MAKEKQQSALRDISTFWSFAACLLGVGGFLLWAIFAPLAEGVTASGQIVVENNRKAVQHLEGGIIRELNVREGDIVEEGDVLLELEQVASLASRQEIAKELSSQLGSTARLNALLNDDPEPNFDVLNQLPISPNDRMGIIARQSELFNQQRTGHETELSVLRARRNTTNQRERDLTRQIDAIERSLSVANQDLIRKRQYIEKGWTTIDELQQSEREVANLEAELSGLIASQNEARTRGREITEEIRNAEAQFLAEISSDLLEAQQRASVNLERLSQTEDVLQRTIIRAPRSGKVLNLAFSTIGGVVRTGDVIMEIVPAEGDLIAEIQVSPTDRDAVRQGQRVEAQLSAYKQWDVPRIEGEVVSVSADLKQVPETGVSYYAARVVLDLSTLEASTPVDLVPGLPVDAFIDSGQKRTFLDMVMEPLSKTVSKGTVVY